MGTTASGFVYPDTGYTSGVRQAIEDLADSAEDVIREAGIPRFADSAARTAAIPSPVLGMKTVLTSDEIVYRYNGSAWKAWESGLTTYTPTPTNLTVGSGTLSARYQYVNGAIHGDCYFIYGAGSAVSGDLTFTLPVTAASRYGTANTEFEIGFGRILDSGTAVFKAEVFIGASTTAHKIRVLNAASTYLGASIISGTVPMTWTTNDMISWQFWYEPA